MSWETAGHIAFAAPFVVLGLLFVGVVIEFVAQTRRGR